MARIKIDIDRKIGEISRNIFGNFAEHLGRCIYGGIYDPESKLADDDGFRKDVIETTKRLGVSIIRWPGGNFASGYHWKDGIGPKENRPKRPELAWNTVETNQFGTDEFIKFCRKVNAQPYIVVNCGSGDMNEAQDWLEYCNSEKDTYWLQQRIKNTGIKQPYKVKYWGIGNEVDGNWQIGHKDAVTYGKIAKEYAKVMKWLDPNIKIIASGSSDWLKDWGIDWDYTIVNELYDKIDYIGTHIYIGNPEKDFKKYMGKSEIINRRIENTTSAIKTALARNKSQKNIYIAMDEWNVWYRTGIEQKLEERYNFADALVVAMFLNSFINHADIVKMANLAQLVNVIAPMITIGDKLLIQSIYYPISEYAKRNIGYALDLFIESEDYEVEYEGFGKFRTKYLDVSCSFNNGTLNLNIVNKSIDQSFDVDIEISGLEPKKEIGGITIKADGPDAENTLEKPDTIRIEKIVPQQFKSNCIKLEVQPLSINFYEIS